MSVPAPIPDDNKRFSQLQEESSPWKNWHLPRKGLLLFCPHKLVDSVQQIKVEELLEKGIRGIILDLDNTLVRWRRADLSKEIQNWLSELQRAGIRLCILSNSVLSERPKRLAEQLGISNIRKAHKPARSGFRRALEALGTPPSATAIIGDQMFTDIWGGNRAGIYTIMVRPLHPGEFIYTRLISRPPERFLLRLFRRRGNLEE